MSTKIFEILPNGQTLASLKKEARKIHKSGKAKSHTSALNALYKEIGGTSLNKASPEIKMNSPRIVNDTLFIPVKLDMDVFDKDGSSFNYFVAMNNEKLSLSNELSIDLSRYNLDINKLELKNFRKIPNELNGSEGWYITFDEIQIIISSNDEGILCDIYDIAEDDEDCIDTTYAFYNELFEEYLGYEFIENQELSDYEAAYKLGHVLDMDRTVICSIGGAYLQLYSTFIVNTGEELLTPEQIVSLVKIENLGEKDFFNWLEGKHYDKFENWIVETTPYFGMETEDGEVLGEIFDTLPKTLSERCLLAAESFIS